MNRAFKLLIIAFALVSFVGCGKISTEYGSSKGLIGRESLNGFGGLRRAYELSGYRSRDVSRLTDRVRRTDVIVWTPQVIGGIDDKVTRWFDRWLRNGDKTLVYIVADCGSEADYWTEAGELAPPIQRIEYRKRAARSINERMVWRLNRDKLISNGWFQIDPHPHLTSSNEIGGPWKAAINSDPEVSSALRSEFSIEPFDPDASKTATTGVVAKGPTGPGSPGWLPTVSTTTTLTKTKFRSMLKSPDGDTIVAEIRSKDWQDSRIIVVAGGSLLTNFAITHPVNQRLAAQIIAACDLKNTTSTATSESPVAGFLTSGWSPISVSETKPGVPVATGWELLTVWPLSLVTMHGALLGFVLCLMLWPIFGRPKRVQLTEHSDFGDHLDAVAALMNRTGGEDYARQRISEYFKRIRGETSGPWIIAEQKNELNPSNPLPPLSLKRTTINKENH